MISRYVVANGTVDCTSNPFFANMEETRDTIEAAISIMLDRNIVKRIDDVYINLDEDIPEEEDDYGTGKECIHLETDDREVIAKAIRDNIDHISSVSIRVDEWADTDGAGGQCSDYIDADGTTLEVSMQDSYYTKHYYHTIGLINSLLGIDMDGNYDCNSDWTSDEDDDLVEEDISDWSVSTVK
jgi:hypothetical protein